MLHDPRGRCRETLCDRFSEQERADFSVNMNGAEVVTVLMEYRTHQHKPDYCIISSVLFSSVHRITHWKTHSHSGDFLSA